MSSAPDRWTLFRSRVPWTEPKHSECPQIREGDTVVAGYGDPWSHALRICAGLAETRVDVLTFDPRSDQLVRAATSQRVPETVPCLIRDGRVVCDDPIAIARGLAPDLFCDRIDVRIDAFRSDVLDAIHELGRITDQAKYEAAHDALERQFRDLESILVDRRFLGGDTPDFVDVLLFTVSVRLDLVFFVLHKATIGLLADYPLLQAHAQDLHELPAFESSTAPHRVRAEYFHHSGDPDGGIVPLGGTPNLFAPHFRDWKFRASQSHDAGAEEDQSKQRIDGEWVRPVSQERNWVGPGGDGTYPGEPGRYHLYAPYNCPWSHRALLARAVKGLQEVVGASVVYFRRDPDRGWQFNPAIPGCTPDLAGGRRYVRQIYEEVGSDERSVPILWDTRTQTIVSNESADIMRMFNDGFGPLAARDLDLYPTGHRNEIDRINETVYQRINNGAYKAGFAESNDAYRVAFRRYFAALDWLEDRLQGMAWLADTEHPTEADLRLFPTVFRHDAVYYARFKLNARRIEDYRRLSDWLQRILAVPGVAAASNLDHARNGYFGRSGNEIVPAGPVPLGLSPKDFARDVWLNQQP